MALKVVLPGAERFDEARRPWNLAVDQRPAAVALPGDAVDVLVGVGIAASMNFADTPRDSRTFWPPQTHERLLAIKARIDPGDLVRANHPLSGAAA